jgi:hypothetical protein
MAGFTPGPWRVDETRALGAYGVWTDYAHPNNPGHDGSGFPIPICFVEPAKPLPVRSERDANARLIASAPCLLAALTEFVRLSDDGNATAEQWGRARAEAVKAIDAATGSQT